MAASVPVCFSQQSAREAPPCNIAHATFNISDGRIEGINNKIKTLRCKGCGYQDDDYFFLKLFDVSRKPYIRKSFIPQLL